MPGSGVAPWSGDRGCEERPQFRKGPVLLGSCSSWSLVLLSLSLPHSLFSGPPLVTRAVWLTALPLAACLRRPVLYHRVLLPFS